MPGIIEENIINCAWDDPIRISFKENIIMPEKTIIKKLNIVGIKTPKLSHYVRLNNVTICGIDATDKKLIPTKNNLCKRCESVYTANKLLFRILN